MKKMAAGNHWRYGWLLFGIALLVMYIPLYWGLINYWHDWFGGWVYYVTQITSNPDALSRCALSLSMFFASTCSLLLGVLGCVLSILFFFKKRPSLAFARWMGVLLCIYLGSVLVVVASELMDPSFGFFRWFSIWVPTSFALYLLPFWVYSYFLLFQHITIWWMLFNKQLVWRGP